MVLYLFFGTLFGFILSRVGATDFNAIAEMFLLENLHLAGVIGVAVASAAPALYLLRRAGIAGPAGCKVTIKPKPRKAGNALGGVIFGAGWAITGTCPGTALAQLGEGRLMAIFTIVGIVGGVALYRTVGSRVEAWLRARSGSEEASLKAEAAAGTGC